MKLLVAHRMIFDLVRPLVMFADDIDEDIKTQVVDRKIKPFMNPHFRLSLLTDRLASAGFCMDRTDLYNEFNGKFLPYLPMDRNFTLGFDECARLRAKELWDTTDKAVVMFSGGVDSTVIACAMLETKPKHKVLQIVYSDGCENGDLLQHNKFKTHTRYVDKAHWWRDHVLWHDPSWLKINGEPGTFVNVGGLDSLGGEENNWFYNKTGKNIENVPWINFIEYYDDFDSRASTPYKIKLIETIAQHIKQAPFDIKTINDLRWWICFTCRTNHAVLMGRICQKLITRDWHTPIDLERHVAFFEHDMFQQWNMREHAAVDRKDVLPYKMHAKQYIKTVYDRPEIIDGIKKNASIHTLLPKKKRYYNSSFMNRFNMSPKIYAVDDKGYTYNDYHPLDRTKLQSLIKR